MKFEVGKFFKGKMHCCEFVKVLAILSDDGYQAELKVEWYTQAFDFWKKSGVVENIVVSVKHYPKWRSYMPWGEERS